MTEKQWDRALAVKAKYLYEYLVQDSWNCYNHPEIYPSRLTPGVHEKFWIELVERLQIIDYQEGQ